MIPFRIKLVLGFAAMVATAELSTVAALDRAIANELVAQLGERLEAQATGSIPWITQGRHPAQVAQRIAAITAARVTVVDESGAVVGDSNAGGTLGPEIVEARAHGSGRDVRDDLLYVAVSTPNGSVIRLGAPLKGVERTISLLRERLLFASGAVFLLAVIVALIVARQLARPLVAMQDVAHKIAGGAYDVDVAAHVGGDVAKSSDELGDLARSLQSLASQLAAVETQRRELLGDISHEIGTPVTAIQGYAETLSRGTTDAATTKEFVAIIHRHAVRIQGLVADLSLLTRLEAKPKAKLREPVSILEIARHVAATVRPRAEERGARIEIDVPENVVAIGDPDGVERIMLNLVDNAVKHGKDAGGRVSVRARNENNAVVVDVEDDGPGIEAADLALVFRRFYRVDKARSRERGGSGLGLAIVQKLAESMGGSASATSEPGKGATFSIRLPASSGTAVAST